MYTNSDIHKCKLTNSVLKQKKFSKIIELDIRFNENIDGIPFITNLKKLNIAHPSIIGQKDIQGLDLIELNISHNDKIETVSFMVNLKKLSAHGTCGIDQKGIQGLN